MQRPVTARAVLAILVPCVALLLAAAWLQTFLVDRDVDFWIVVLVTMPLVVAVPVFISRVGRR